MCAPTAISGVLGAVGDAQGVAQDNQNKIRQYKIKDRMRVTKAIRDDLLYKTKKVQYEQNVDSANIAAQRSYTDAQISLNKNMSEIFLKNYESMQDMFKTGGEIEVGFAERGVGGSALAKALLVNKAKLGIVETNRARFLTNTVYDMNRSNQSTQIKLKDVLNKEFSSVALQPVRDIPDPPPILGNPGLTFALGAGKALASGFAAGEFESTPDWSSNLNNSFDIDFDGTDSMFGSGPGQIPWSSTFEFDTNWMS